MNLRIFLDKAWPHKFVAIDLRLRDGSVIENLAVNSDGFILGKIIGGQDGIDESPLSFKQEDIQAFRLRSGLLARLRIATWRRVKI